MSLYLTPTQKSLNRNANVRDVLSRMQHLKISSLQDESVLQDFTNLIATHLANGEERCVKVVGITPSRVVWMVYNSPVTTVRTRTPLTTTPVTSTESVTTVTTGGTPRTTQTTIPTSPSSTEQEIYTLLDEGWSRDRIAKAMGMKWGQVNRIYQSRITNDESRS